MPPTPAAAGGEQGTEDVCTNAGDILHKGLHAGKPVGRQAAFAQGDLADG